MSVFDFIETPLGLFCTGVFSGIIGNFIYKGLVLLYEKANNKVKHKRFIKRLASIGEYYCSGYTAAYAKYKSTFHQVLLTTKFTMNLLMGVFWIVIVALAALGLLIVFQKYLIVRPIIVAIASVVIAIQYQKVKTLLKTYRMMFDHEFGEDYKKHMMEGMEKHWEELTGKETKTESID